MCKYDFFQYFWQNKFFHITLYQNYQAIALRCGLEFLQPFIKVKDKICTAQFCCIWSTLWKNTCWNFKGLFTMFFIFKTCKIMKTNFICKSCRTYVTINSVNTFIPKLVVSSTIQWLKIQICRKNMQNYILIFTGVKFQNHGCKYKIHILFGDNVCWTRELSLKF